MQIYNTMTRKKEELIPISENQVNIYACGPTVYNYIHIGNARPICAFDVLRRYLKYRGYNVKYVQNFTDVDDKIIKKANEEGIPASEVSEKYIAEYKKDSHGLNVMDADVHPKVTESMDIIIDLVKKLVETGHAYEKNGDVYFRTSSFKDYGKLSGMPIEELQAGARIDVNDIRKILLTLLYGNQQKKANLTGNPHGEKAVRAGILNVLQCHIITSEIHLIFTAEVRTLFSLITKMKLHNLKLLQENLLQITGCTTDI